MFVEESTMKAKLLPARSWLLLHLWMLPACSGAAEAPRVHLKVESDPSAIAPVTTDMGYVVTLTEARLVLRDFEFTTAGELHTASLLRRACDWLVPSVSAHPGHYQGGTIVGELPGRFMIDALAEKSFGTADLLVADYEAANFTFALATTDDVPADDPLLGHTALLRGTATQGDRSIEFLALIDAPEGRSLVGAPFQYEVTQESQSPIGFQLLPFDPFEKDTLFDGLDFGVLDTNDDGQVTLSAAAPEGLEQDAYFTLRNTFMTHDHFDFAFEEGDTKDF